MTRTTRRAMARSNPSKRFKKRRRKLKRKTLWCQILKWTMLLKFCKNSTREERTDLTAKMLLSTQPWRRRAISRPKSKRSRDKREKRECSGRRWPRFFQTRISQSGELWTKHWPSITHFWSTDKTWSKKLVFWISKTKSLKRFSISISKPVSTTTCKCHQLKLLD